MKEIGTVCCFPSPPSHVDFCFQLNDEAEIKVGSYIEIPSGKYVIVARVKELNVFSELFKNPQFLQGRSLYSTDAITLLPKSIGMLRIARAIIVGVIDGNDVLPPCISPEPGDLVYPVNKGTLVKVLGLKNNGVFIGTLADRDDIPVYLNPEILIRLHSLIIGTIGTGKSYTAGVIIEDMLKFNYPVIVIDPHGEYEIMSKPNTSKFEILELRKLGMSPEGVDVKVFKPKIHGAGDLSLNFDSLDVDSIAELIRATDTMKDLLFLAINHARKNKIKLSPQTLSSVISQIAYEWKFAKRTMIALRRNIEILSELGIFGAGFNPRILVQPGQLTVIDLSEDMPEHVRRAFIAVLLRELFLARKRKEIPKVLVVIDECHRFISPDEVGADSACLNSIKRIAREGRKFGIGLCLISQRIVGLDKTIVGQCRTKIILRLDMYTDIDQVAPYFADEIIKHKLANLPDGYAYIVGAAVRAPILVKIRPKRSDHIRE